MQPLPLLFRQSLRTGAGFAKPSPHNRNSVTALRLKFSPSQRSPLSKFGPSICPRCEFRAQSRFYSVHGDQGGPGKDSKDGGSLESESRSSTHGEKPEQTPSVEDSTTSQSSYTSKEQAAGPTDGSQSRRQVNIKENGRRLPSHWESRRSELSKQFSQLMDNVQSNVFIANRHLNDLTGYSAIEKLKQEILAQGMILWTLQSLLGPTLLHTLAD